MVTERDVRLDDGRTLRVHDAGADALYLLVCHPRPSLERGRDVGGDRVTTIRGETPTETKSVLRLGGWAAYANGVVSAIGLVFLVAMYASFAVGATSPGLVFGWINDVSAVVAAVLILPLVVALHVLLRPQAPILSGVAMLIGIGANVAIMVLQSLLVVGALTFEEEIGPVLIAFIVLVVWLVTTGYLESSSGALPHGLRMGLLAVTYVGYPIWAFWLGRHLLQLVRESVTGQRAGAEPQLEAER